MNLIRKGHGPAHRGIIGVESAIVLIAFVIVAAALAFVVLNMGFATTQKAKTTIISSLAEASSSLEISGKVTGFGDVTGTQLNATSVPVKLTSGGDSVDLDDARTSVKYISNTVEYDNILTASCTLPATTTYNSTSDAFDDAVAGACQLDANPITATGPSQPTLTTAVIYWSVASNTNTILESGEHAVLAIAWRTADQPQSLDKVRAEILIPSGATLTVERNVPNISNSIIDLG